MRRTLAPRALPLLVFECVALLASIVTTTVLVDPVLSLASVVGLGCGLGLGYAAVLVTQVYAHAFGCVVGGLVGFAVVSVGLSPVYAGCKSLFVCIAEEPDVLAQRAPELHGKGIKPGVSGHVPGCSPAQRLLPMRGPPACPPPPSLPTWRRI